jgi:hypothetical protein
MMLQTFTEQNLNIMPTNHIIYLPLEGVESEHWALIVDKGL